MCICACMWHVCSVRMCVVYVFMFVKVTVLGKCSVLYKCTENADAY